VLMIKGAYLIHCDKSAQSSYVLHVTCVCCVVPWLDPHKDIRCAVNILTLEYFISRRTLFIAYATQVGSSAVKVFFLLYYMFICFCV